MALKNSKALGVGMAGSVLVLGTWVANDWSPPAKPLGQQRSIREILAMRIKTAVRKGGVLGAALLGTAIAAPAIAGCDYGKTGYLYLWASCVQDPSGDPKNICQVERRQYHKPGFRAKKVFFVSNVIADTGGNNRFPSTGFFSAIQNQHNVTLNGSESACYRTRDEARDSRDRMISDRKRSDYLIRRVELRDH